MGLTMEQSDTRKAESSIGVDLRWLRSIVRHEANRGGAPTFQALEDRQSIDKAGGRSNLLSSMTQMELKSHRSSVRKADWSIHSASSSLRRG